MFFGSLQCPQDLVAENYPEPFETNPDHSSPRYILIYLYFSNLVLGSSATKYLENRLVEKLRKLNFTLSEVEKLRKLGLTGVGIEEL